MYEFGPYRIDAALSRLERAGRAIPLPPKAFDLLVLLAKNSDRVVGKTELIETLWPNTFVDEGNLTQHIYTLRKALGNQPDGRPYIETVARRGYRLAVPVRGVDPPAAPQAPPAALVREGERKQATVLHCTVANAAAVIERLGSAGMHELIDGLMTAAARAVAQYEGAISQRHADGFVAVFGAPVVHEDDAQRSVLAALDIQRRFREIAAAAGHDDGPLDLQMGIDTGPLVIGRVTGDRHVEYTAVGETTRIADLLQQFAQPGAILISEATHRAAATGVRADPIVVPTLPGERGYAVTGVRRAAKAALRFGRSRAPLVGRHDELRLLDGLVTQILRGNGHTLSLVGEPGMGKSRLVAEFTRQRSAGALLILEGRCVSYGSLVPYLPLADVVRAYCGVDESDPPETMRDGVARAIGDLGLTPDGAACLLRLVGVDADRTAVDTLSPEAVKAQTFDMLRLLCLKTAAHRPLVIVVEDVHWIDRTSEEFLMTLVERLAGARVLLVATHRPGYRVPWMERSYATQITLAPLGEADSARLVQSVARERPLDADVSNAILSRGEGNPFFLEELARTVVEHGPGAQAIPETVHGVIMARIDRLSDTAKRLLQTASVIGREVPLALLRRVWTGAVHVEAELAELCRLEFLFERASGEEPSYVFKHALTQDVAYDSLLARTRRELHLRAARTLEELYPDRVDEMAATLAYHYARTDIVEKAVTWLARAAERAARVYANAEAILHLDLASRRLQRLPEGPGRDRWMVAVALQQAHSLYFLGRFRESVDVLLPHEARLARLNDAALTAGYSFWLAHMYSRLGDQRRATDSARRAIDAATAAGDEATLGKAHGLLALEAHWAGTPAAGVAHGCQAIALLERRADQRWWLGMAHFYLAINHLLAGDFDHALAQTARAAAAGREIGDPRLQTYAGYTTGWVEASRGNHESAVASCRASLEQAPDRVSRAYASLFLGFALIEQGRHEEARSYLEPVVSELEAFAFPQWHALAAALMGETSRRLGRLDEADAFVQRGLQVATRVGYGYAVAVSQRIAARVARDRGATQQAADAFQQAADTFGRSGAIFESVRTRAELGQG